MNKFLGFLRTIVSELPPECFLGFSAFRFFMCLKASSPYPSLEVLPNLNEKSLVGLIMEPVSEPESSLDFSLELRSISVAEVGGCSMVTPDVSDILEDGIGTPSLGPDGPLFNLDNKLANGFAFPFMNFDVSVDRVVLLDRDDLLSLRLESAWRFSRPHGGGLEAVSLGGFNNP